MAQAPNGSGRVFQAGVMLAACQPGDLSPCDRCGSTERKVAVFGLRGELAGVAVVQLCIMCLATGIDLVTGWKFTNNVRSISRTHAAGKELAAEQGTKVERLRARRRARKAT